MQDSTLPPHPLTPSGCSELSEWQDQNTFLQTFLLPSWAVAIYKVQHAVSV